MQLEPVWIYPPALSVAEFFIVSLLSALLFVLIGRLFSLPLYKRGLLSLRYFGVCTIVSSALVSYVVYFLFLINTYAGKVACFMLYGGVLMLVCVLIWKVKKQGIGNEWKKLSKVFLFPILLSLVVSMFYSAIIFGCESTGKIAPRNQFCSIIDTTFDNSLPLSFSLSTYQGQGKAAVSDWSSTDRPPLQSALYITQIPFTRYIGNPAINYQIFAVFLQCLWLVALVEFLRLLPKNLKEKVDPSPVIVLAVLSNFIFLNSVFVWPKMLAGTFVVFSFVILVDSMRQKNIKNESITLFAITLGLGMLAHGGVIFTLLPLSVLSLIILFQKLSFKKVALFLFILLLIYTPWALYRSAYGASGDRLVKWWIAGVIAPNNMSTGETLVSSYTETPPRELIENKIDNTKTIFVGYPYQGPIANRETVGLLMNIEGSYFFPSLGFSLIGAFMLLLGMRKNQNSKRSKLNNMSFEALALTVAALSLFCWILLSFGPPNAPTIAYAGSYATYLLIFFSLLIYLLRSRKVANLAALLAMTYFFLSIVYSYSRNSGLVSWRYVFVSLLLLVIFLYLTKRFSSRLVSI